MSEDGTRVAIGTQYNSGKGYGNSGQVRIYDLMSGKIPFWQQVGQVINGEARGDKSGISVAMSADGTRVAIGSTGNDDNGVSSGHVRIYDLERSDISGKFSLSWTQVGEDIDGEARGDKSGTSVAMSADGSIVAIGAPGYDDLLDTKKQSIFIGNTGHVRIYNLSIEGIPSWEQVGQDIVGEKRRDYSGLSVAMSAAGTRVAIGGAGQRDRYGPYSGHVRIYDLVRSENGRKSWEKVGKYDIYGGTSVAMSADGNRVATGSPYNDNDASKSECSKNRGPGCGSGDVRIYDLTKKVSGSSSWFYWEKVGPDIYGKVPGGKSGFSVAMSADGTRVAIAAQYNNGHGARSGHVRVYDLIYGQWKPKKVGQDIDGERSDGDHQFEYSLAMSADGSRVAIGAPYNDASKCESQNKCMCKSPSECASKCASKSKCSKNSGHSGHVHVYEVCVVCGIPPLYFFWGLRLNISQYYA
jgi:hypothetical protein